MPDPERGGGRSGPGSDPDGGVTPGQHRPSGQTTLSASRTVADQRARLVRTVAGLSGLVLALLVLAVGCWPRAAPVVPVPSFPTVPASVPHVPVTVPVTTPPTTPAPAPVLAAVPDTVTVTRAVPRTVTVTRAVPRTVTREVVASRARDGDTSTTTVTRTTTKTKTKSHDDDD